MRKAGVPALSIALVDDQQLVWPRVSVSPIASVA